MDGFNRRLAIPEDPRQQLARQMAQRQTQGGGFEPSALIAEGGGIGGALAGGAAGAAVGSVVPVVGTALGGIIGAGLGGFFGGFGGSAAEQKIRDGKVDLGKAAKTGAIEGVTSAGPIKLLKAGKAVYGAAKSGKAVAPSVADAVNNTLLKRISNRAGQALEQTGGKMMNSQTSLTRAAMRQIGANTPEMFMNMNKRFGLTKLDDIAAVSRNVTGQNGIHSEAVRNILFSGQGIDTADLRNSLPGILDSKAPLVDTGTRKRIQTQVDNAIQSMYADQPLNPLGNPGAAFDVSRSFRDQAALLRRGANPSGADKQLAKVYDTVAGELEKKLYSQPGIESVLPAVRDNMVKTYQALASQASGAQRRAYRNLAAEASQIQSIKDLRSAQKIWVQAARVDEKTAEASGNAATKLSGGGGLLSRAGNAFLDNINPAAGSATAKTGRAVSQTGPLLQRLNNTGTRAALGAGTANIALQGGEPSADLLGQVNQPTNDGSLLQTALQPGQDATALLLGQSTRPQLPEQGSAEYYQSGAARAAAAGDLESAQALMALAESVGGGAGDLTNTQQKGLMSMQNALAQVDQLESLFNQAGGGQGRVGGFVSGLTGKAGLNAEANAYRQRRAGAAALIARALGESGTMTDQDIKRALDQIPDIQDTPQEALIKWQGLRSILNSVGQNVLSINSGPADDLLTQMNGV